MLLVINFSGNTAPVLSNIRQKRTGLIEYIEGGRLKMLRRPPVVIIY